MAFGALAGVIGRTRFRSTTPKGKGRKPRPISSGPKRGRPTRRVTDPTSRAAIRRAEARRRGRGSSGPSPSRGPVRGRTTRSINTGSRRRSPLSLRRRMRKGRCK